MSEKDINSDFARQPIERYQWPLAGGMVLLVLATVIGERRRTAPRASGARLANAAAIAVSLLLSPAAEAKDPEHLYRQGKYKEAQEAYEELLRRDPTSDRLAFNHGAAAYRNRDFK